MIRHGIARRLVCLLLSSLAALAVAAVVAVRAWAQAPAAQQPPQPSPVQPHPQAGTRPKTYQEQVEERIHVDWPFLARFRDEDAKVPPPAPGEERVVFMGDSITEGWGKVPGSSFFPGKPYFNRGISGQTTPQMLVRFRQDVIALKPRVVVILGGINDIAGNTGPMTLSMTEDNIASMCDLARANGISVVLSSVLPARAFPWKPGVDPRAQVTELNAWIKDYAARNGFVYLDYYSATVDSEKGFKADLASDGVHPNQAGYAIMAPLAEDAIKKAFALKPARRR